MEHLYTLFKKLLRITPTDFIRYKYNDVKWDSHMLGIVGPRGVGKTTMLLQYIKKNLDPEETLYVAADNMFFSYHTLIELADKFDKKGGKYLFIDEIHKYEHWSEELTELYNSYPDMHIYFIGSSVFDIHDGSSVLSKNVPVYEIQGLSFREYLAIFYSIEVPTYSLEEILENNVEIPGITHPLPLFNEYLRKGYYPFGQELEYAIVREKLICKTMEMDIPQYTNMNVSTGRKLKQLLMIIAQQAPFKPVLQTLADQTKIGRNNISDYLSYLEKSGLLMLVKHSADGIKNPGKIDKIYLDNSNLLETLNENKENTRCIPETFFYNQMRVNHKISFPKTSDLGIDQYTFDFTETKKSRKNLLLSNTHYIVKENIEHGNNHIIPLWYFGFNY